MPSPFPAFSKSLLAAFSAALVNAEIDLAGTTGPIIVRGVFDATGRSIIVSSNITDENGNVLVTVPAGTIIGTAYNPFLIAIFENGGYMVGANPATGYTFSGPSASFTKKAIDKRPTKLLFNGWNPNVAGTLTLTVEAGLV